MDSDEIRLRALYLFLACSQSIESLKDKVIKTLPKEPVSTQMMRDLVLKRELGMLFRYWTTRKIWERLEADEASAKGLNLALLRLFTQGFKLPMDGSGLHYAELSTPDDHR